MTNGTPPDALRAPFQPEDGDLEGVSLLALPMPPATFTEAQSPRHLTHDTNASDAFCFRS